MSLRLHIDTDGGVDDALALVALARSGVEIASVSAVFGNTWVDQAASNARWVLRLSGCAADVFVGAEAGLALRPFQHRRPGHGHDGMNGAGGSPRRRLPPLDRPHGVGLIALAARQGVSGLFMGPLTNLARASLEDPAAFHDWRPVVMAGAFDVDGQGHGGADFNTWSDPEALQRVLWTGVNPRLVPLDVTSKVLIETDAFRRAAENSQTPLVQKLWQAVGPYIDQHRALWGGEGCRPHDAVAAAAALWPELFTYEPAHVGLDPNRFGRLERIDGAPNAEICTAVQAAEVSRRLAHALFG